MKTIIIYGLNKQNKQRLKEQTTGVELTARGEDRRLQKPTRQCMP